MARQGTAKGYGSLQTRDIVIAVEGFDLGIIDFPQKVKGKGLACHGY